ncbi:hypothetical protein [Mucilaginibacter aquariorum]|uniref:hypothetical protein n=1 Tax=Mucilaginibacter aquariorum TaxID=2967225 RepID=UPI002114C52A|nr:hypothetical protein [Mucilaginibacter aquariorum]
MFDQKVTKNQVGKKASLPHKAFALQIGQNHGLESFSPLRSLIGPRFSKISYAPTAHKATIVLPAFARSCFADGGGSSHLSLLVILSDSEGSNSELCLSKLHVGD